MHPYTGASESNARSSWNSTGFIRLHFVHNAACRFGCSWKEEREDWITFDGLDASARENILPTWPPLVNGIVFDEPMKTHPPTELDASKPVSFRLSAEEYAAFEREAGAEKISPGALAKRIVLSRGQGRPATSVDLSPLLGQLHAIEELLIKLRAGQVVCAQAVLVGGGRLTPEQAETWGKHELRRASS